MGDLPNNFNSMNPEDDNPLGDLDPMEWLESLAKKQGAHEGFTTSADLTIEDIDPDSVVIDEPGYTPSEVISSRHQNDPQPEPQAPPTQQPPPEMPEPTAPEIPMATAATPVDDGMGEMGIPDDVDPLTWLESLAKKQGAYEGFTTAADMHIDDIDPDSVVIDEPGYTPSEVISSRHRNDPQPQPPIEDPQAATPEIPMAAAATPVDDGMGEMGIPDDVDPLTWLESLAKKQGAYEGFTTAADMHIDDIDPDSVVIDEPGYTPSEVISSRHRNDPQPEEPIAATDDFLSELDSQDLPGFDVEFGDDPLAPDPAEDDFFAPPVAERPPEPIADDGAIGDFLDDLGSEEIPGFDLDFATDVDEQAQPAAAANESPLNFLSGFAVDDGEDDDFFAEPAAADTDGLDFLNDLDDVTVEPTADVDWLDTIAANADDDSDNIFTEDDAPEAIEATHTPDELEASIEGMSDEEIAQKQASGELTGEQELAWLMGQAKAAAEARAQEEEYISDEDLEPAEAGEIPPWLQNATVVDENESMFADSDAFTDDIDLPPTPDEALDWLETDGESAIPEMELPDFDLEDASEAPEPVNELPEPSEMTIAVVDEVIRLDDYDSSNDDWAEALDEEYDRQAEGLDDEDPTWFRIAQEAAHEDDENQPEDPTLVAQPPMPTDLMADTPSEDTTPEWLAPPTEELPENEDDLPEWLRPMAGADSGADGNPDFEDIETWLREEETGGSAPSFGQMDLAADTAEEILGDAEPRQGSEIDTWLRQEESATSSGTGFRPTSTTEMAALASLPDAEDEDLPPAREGNLPAWASEESSSASAPAPARPAAPPPPAPTRATAPPPPHPIRMDAATNQPVPAADAPAPVPANYAQYQATLEANPEDHATRLQLAREMAKAGDVGNSVDQYQTLVEHMGEMDDVSNDLRGLIQTNPQLPALRRLLGDVYMRQGYLQEALDAYRGALDNL